MAAGDTQKIVERVYYRVEPMLSSEKRMIFRFEIESMVDSALNRLGDRVAEGPDFAVLQRTQSVTITSGVGPLAATTVVRSIPMKGDVLLGSDTYSAQFLPSKQDLELGGRPSDFHYYTIRGGAAGGGSVFIYDGTGAAASGAAVVRANYYPVQAAGGDLADLPVQLNDDLIDILVAMCQEKMGKDDQVPPGVSA